MSVFFFDSSGLVKRHVNETGSPWVRSLTRVKAGHTLDIARVTAVEITSAITRRQRGGFLSAAQAGAMLGHFRRHLTQRYSILELTPHPSVGVLKVGGFFVHKKVCGPLRGESQPGTGVRHALRSPSA